LGSLTGKNGVVGRWLAWASSLVDSDMIPNDLCYSVLPFWSSQEASSGEIQLRIRCPHGIVSAITLGVLAYIFVAHSALAQLSEKSGATNEFRMKLAARGADNIPEIDPNIPAFHVGPATGGQGRGSLSAEGGANPAFDTRPSAAAVRIDANEAPIIDADLSDPAWAKATLIQDFRQTDPDVGAPATEPTDLRIMYDENNLYFGVYSYDSVPADIVLRSMERDGEIFTGDNFYIYLDPGLTRRNAYLFQIGASGGRGDTLLLNNTRALDEWDIIWEARARVVEDGWIAELAIPFRSLSYEPDQTDWGFDFKRDIQRKNEEVYWSSVNPNLNFTDVSQAGTLTGITDINRGIGLDIQTYGVVRAKRDWHIEGEDTGISFSGGGNAFYRITPALTGTLTFNPDFSDAPLDARQVNTTRFSLFFPETRDFFLQDAATFEFGGRGFARGELDRAANNGRPFFSRNIGLVDGQPVSIVGGGKLSGDIGGFGVGLFSVLTDKTPDAGGQVLSVARISRPVFDESQIGFIVTNGDPTGATTNSVAGIDYQYRNSNLWGGNVFQSDIFYQRSFSDTRGDDDTFGIALNFPNEPWGGDLTFKEVGANYEPALGFINRTGIRVYEANARHLTRYGTDSGFFLRQLQFSTNNVLVTGLDDVLQSRENSVRIQAITQRTHQFAFGVTNFFESVSEPFFLPDDVIVPIGKYDWTNFSARLQTSRSWPLSLSAEVACCRFLNGSSLETTFQANFRPNQYYEIGASHEWTRLRMPNGDINIHVASLNATITFTPDMQLALQTQYDNISQNFGLLARYRWEFIPGSELLIVFGQAATIPNSRFVAQRSQFTIRIGHTLRL